MNQINMIFQVTFHSITCNRMVYIRNILFEDFVAIAKFATDQILSYDSNK